MNDSTTNPSLKRCFDCKIFKTLDCFSKDKSRGSGVCPRCKACQRQRYNERRTPILENKRRYYNEHRDQLLERQHVYDTANREQKRCRDAEYRGLNRERRRIRDRRYYRQNRQTILAKKKLYTRKHPEKQRIYKQKREARKRSYPDTLTHSEWLKAVEWFHGCCAVCGRQAQDLFSTHTLAADHWIPLSSPDCPGTVAGNIVPLCHGENGCNNSKQDKVAEIWLVERYGKHKSAQILTRIQQYFDSLE
jgi:hypothetical protein